MNYFFKTETSKYTFYGAVFGLMFPITASLVDSLSRFGDINILEIIQAQISSPLLWIIDSAPIWLGIFARIGGIRQDKLIKNAESLEKRVKEKTASLLEVNQSLEKAVEGICQTGLDVDSDPGRV